MHLLIVDDHPVVIKGCRAMFSGRPDIELSDVANGAEGVAAYERRPADVVLMDVNLPDISGFEATRRILSRDLDARIAIFSMNSDPAIAARAIEVGARAFLPKSDPPERFLDAVEALMAGGTYLSPIIAGQVAFLVARAPSSISDREREILRGLATGSDLYAIAKRLDLSYKTVANNCALLRAKVGARTTHDLVRFAIEHQIA